MVYDHGSKKWTSLMLPEHQTLLSELWNEDKKQKKPLLDSQEIEHIHQELLEAYDKQSTISLRVYKNGSITTVFGTISKFDKNKGALVLNLPQNEATVIYFQDIIAIGE